MQNRPVNLSVSLRCSTTWCNGHFFDVVTQQALRLVDVCALSMKYRSIICDKTLSYVGLGVSSVNTAGYFS